jgi:flavin reductase (DIM6/NTAB) family NADH-FMN oxidoreductase RutF
MSVCFTHPANKFKDSYRNILETKKFTVNIISEPFVHAANWTCVDMPHDVDEWVGSGLTPEPAVLGGPPRVKESAYSMECELFQAHDFHSMHPARPSNSVTQSLVLGLIKLIHVRNSVLLKDDNPNHSKAPVVDPAKLMPIGRLGGATFGYLGGAYDIKRPVWKDIEGVEPVQSLYQSADQSEETSKL